MSSDQPPRRPTVPVPKIAPKPAPSLGDVRPNADRAGGSRDPRYSMPLERDPLLDRAPPALHPLAPRPPGPSHADNYAGQSPDQYAPDPYTDPYSGQSSRRPPAAPYQGHSAQHPAQSGQSRPLSGREAQPRTYVPPTHPTPRPPARPIDGHADEGMPRTLRTARAAYEPEPPAVPSRVGRVVLWTALGSTVLAASLVVGLMVATPVGLVRDQLAHKIKVRTGRDLVVKGPTTLTFFPSISLGLSDVSLSASPAMGGGPTITMQKLEAKIGLMPLLRRQVAIRQLVLRQPVVDLRIDKQGRKSWDFADAAELMPQQAYRVAQAGGARPQPGLPRELENFVKSASPDSREATVSKGPLAVLEDLVLGDARIERGTIRYADERTGVAEEVTALDLTLSLDSIQSPLTAKGSLIWRAEPVAFDGRLTSPKALSEDRPARLTAKLTGRPGDLTYEGQLTLGTTTGRSAEWDGDATLKAVSLKALSGWLGTTLPEMAGFGPLTFAGHIKATDANLVLTNTKASLDGVTAQGTLTIDQRGTRPMLRGQLQLSELDLNKYALPKAVSLAPAVKAAPVKPAVKTAPRAVSPPPAANTKAIAPGAPAAQSIEDLLKADEPVPTPGRPPTRVQGFTQRDGWNEQLIDLSALGLLDADLKFNLGGLKVQDLKAGATAGTLQLRNRVLKANIDDMQLYEGRGRGILNVDATLPAIKLALNVSLDGASAMPLLADAAKFNWLAGKGRIALALGGQGLSEREIVEGLEGKADFAFQNGQIVGIDIPKLIQAAMRGQFSGFNHNPAEKTEFSEFAGSFVVSKGVAQNNDLRLTTPMLQVTGAGSATLPTRSLDYMMKPKLTAAGGAGIEIPVKMTGSWERPTIQPDLGTAMKNPDAAINTIRQLGEQFKGGDGVNKAKDLLNQFLKPR
jgi:AsmA protein